GVQTCALPIFHWLSYLCLFDGGASGTDHSGDEGRRDRQLGGCERKGLACQRFVHAVHLVEHLAGLDLGNVVLHVALAVAHPDFGRLLRDRLVGEDADPHAAATLDVAGHRASRSLDLARSQATTAGGLEAVLAERDRSASRRETLVTALLFLAVFASSGLQHRSLLVWGAGPPQSPFFSPSAGAPPAATLRTRLTAPRPPSGCSPAAPPPAPPPSPS